MRILTRYLLRAHAGPFLFALSTLTGLLFLNSVARRLEDLFGKGLDAGVILEFLFLTLPHTIALTLPMAVLVAVLYAFSELTASNEVMAMKAGGLRPQRIMAPLLVMGAVMGGVMLYFNNDILPETNHRLRNLLNDINRKSPTLVFREGVVNPIRTLERGVVYYLYATTIDNETNRLTDVAIVDVSNPSIKSTIYASRATMAFNEQQTDLYLTLFDGVSYEAPGNQPGVFSATDFERARVAFQGIGNVFSQSSTEGGRGEREMDIAMLDSAAAVKRADLAEVQAQNRFETEATVMRALGRSLDELRSRTADTTAQLPAFLRPGGIRTDTTEEEGLDEGSWSERDELTQLIATSTSRRTQVVATLRQTESRYLVEKHKKYTLAFACFVFVLVGGPLAVRFPRAGLGLVIAASSAIFAIYWAGLMGGETIADRRLAPASLTMWVPNLVFGLIGVWLYATMGRESATSRGGGWEDIWWSIRTRVLRLFGGGPGGRPAGAAAGSEAR